MNSKDKFLNTIQFVPDAIVPDYEFGYWYDTIQRWYGEGLPKKNPPVKIENDQMLFGEASAQPDHFGRSEGGSYCSDVRDFFNLDERIHSVAMSLLPIPQFEEEVISQDNENIVYRRSDGKIVRTKKDGTSMPLFLDYPVKKRKDLRKFFERFNPDSQDRFPPDKEWQKLVVEYRKRTYPLQLGGGSTFNGFFSVLRELMGLEKTMVAFYDEPSMVHEILDFFTEFYIRIFSKALSDVAPDYIFIWEDMAFNKGPLISPAIFDKFIIGYYKKFICSMKELGINHFFVDTDGNCEVLIPLFLEAGVTGLLPFEVKAGTDIEKIRIKYPKLIILGGINKIALSKDENEIGGELKKVERMIKTGGYIPFTDHAVPPDVSFDNYCFFRQGLKKILRGNTGTI